MQLDYDEVDVLTPPRGMLKNSCFANSWHGDGAELTRICRKDRSRHEQILRTNARRRTEWMRRERQIAARNRTSLLAEPWWTPDEWIYPEPEMDEEATTFPVYYDIFDDFEDQSLRRYEEWIEELEEVEREFSAPREFEGARLATIDEYDDYYDYEDV